MVQCLERSVDNDVDIIFSEFLYDDDFSPEVNNTSLCVISLIIRLTSSLDPSADCR